jgi:hypothetical protein
VSDAALPVSPVAIPEPVIAPRDRRMRWFELALVLAIAFLRPLTGSIHIFLSGQQKFAGSTPFGWGYATANELLAIVLLAYVLRRTGRGFRDIGLRWSWRECGYGLLLAVAAVFAISVGSRVLLGIFHAAGIDAALRSGSGYWGAAFFNPWSFPYFLLTPFHEEILVRAYMMTEILELTGSRALAIALSVAFQAAYHIYYGWFGMLRVAFTFLVFALYFARSRRALPCIVGHELYDIFVTLAAH